jgi:hypothetical protein
MRQTKDRGAAAQRKVPDPVAQMRAILQFALDRPHDRDADVFAQLLAFATVSVGGFTSQLVHRFTIGDVAEARARILAACAAIVDAGLWVPGEHLADAGLFVTRRDDGSVRRLFTRGGRLDWRTALTWTLAAIVEHGGHALRRCPRTDCARLFVKQHKQVYCSEACSQVMRSRAHYATRGDDVRARRRSAYMASRQPAKVTPRSRLQRIATGSLTEGKKQTQLKQAETENPPIPTRRKRRA